MIDATVGGASANSYVTEDEAIDYLYTRLGADLWLDADAIDQERALIQAAVRIDQERYRGRKASTTQAMEWPRSGVTDPDGNSIGSSTIPTAIKRAQIELAFSLLTESDAGGDPLADTGLEGFERIKIDVIEIEPRQRAAGAFPSHVRRFLQPYLWGSAVQFRVVRG